MENKFDVIIIGGGLAGLTAAILLSRQKKKVLVIEKKTYPFHKVCGEYVSNEVLPFLRSMGFDPFDYGATSISRLRISTPSGKNIYSPLGLGGFGLSRFTMDDALYKIALKSGAEIFAGVKATNTQFNDNVFSVETNNGETFSSQLVIGCYGKRDTLDKKLQRGFIQSRTHYMGVKYHVKTDYPSDEVGLDNFKGGYCGIVKIENQQYNLCYLYKRDKNDHFNNIKDIEEQVLFRNPVIKQIFSNAEFVNTEPFVINEISFAAKSQVQNHIFMCGDSAGLITPLCGNGMSMAIHAAKLLSELILDNVKFDKNPLTATERSLLEINYQKIWEKHFGRRLFLGRTIQKLFGNPVITELSVRSVHHIPKLERWLIESTHGTVF